MHRIANFNFNDMKKILFLLMAVFPMMCMAQEILFILQSDGSFKTQEGKDYIVIEHQGKTAQELYALYLTQATTSKLIPQKTTKHAQERVELISNNVEGKTFTVNACVEKMAETAGSISIHMMGKYWACNFVCVLQFKDEKVRIDAPIMKILFFEKEKVNWTGGLHEDYRLDSFKPWCKQFCDFKKDGMPNLKNDCYNSTNKRMNEEIAKLLIDKQEDW